MSIQAAGGKTAATEFRVRSREVSRIEAFSDVVFGFALTLLVVSLEVPHTFTQLVSDMRGFLPFAICFAIFAHVWWLHHIFFRRYGLDDGVTAALNFVLLFVMLLYVYPMKFVFTGMFNGITGHQYRGAGGEAWIEPQQAPHPDDHLWAGVCDGIFHLHPVAPARIAEKAGARTESGGGV
jgi:Endosomal/lysosomal potassium channel TMEM175